MKSKANGLMGDLESIKALLEEDDLASDEALWDIAQKPTKRCKNRCKKPKSLCSKIR